MSAIKQFLREAFPDVSAELAERAAAELCSIGKPAEGDAAEFAETAEILREEIGRLNTEIVRHKDGIKHASRAGLDVLGERARQRRLEGYDDDHDDSHDDYSLAAAAIAYATDARLRGTAGRGFEQPPPDWPWSPADWKPKQIRRSLIVAAALLVAEIERMDRSGIA